MAKNDDIDYSAINLISNGSVINGEITSTGDVRIDGILNGNITTKGKIVIGETGSVKGEIQCKNGDILGKVEGKIFVTELLSLKSTAVITGEIKINRLAIEPGCKFNGTCDMNSVSSNGNGQEEKVERSSK